MVGENNSESEFDWSKITNNLRNIEEEYHQQVDVEINDEPFDEPTNNITNVFFSAPSKTQSLTMRATGYTRQRMLDVVNFCDLIVGNFSKALRK